MRDNRTARAWAADRKEASKECFVNGFTMVSGFSGIIGFAVVGKLLWCFALIAVLSCWRCLFGGKDGLSQIRYA